MAIRKVVSRSIDSTSTDVSFADLTVDTSTLVVDETNNRVGIGTTAPDVLLDIEGSGATQHINSTSGNANVLFKQSGTTQGSIEVGGSGPSLYLTANNASGSIYLRSVSDVGVQIQPGGIVAKPNQPMFRVKPNANLTHGTTVTKIQLNTETFDVGSNFDTSNYRFVAPIDGKYWFTYTTLIEVGGGVSNYIRAWFYKNGSAYNDGLGDQGTYGGYQRLTFSDCIDLSASDYVEVFAMGATGSAMTYGTYTWFSGHLLG